jgi:hypothetical protein
MSKPKLNLWAPLILLALQSPAGFAAGGMYRPPKSIVTPYFDSQIFAACVLTLGQKKMGSESLSRRLIEADTTRKVGADTFQK